jgi:hypothetical protein
MQHVPVNVLTGLPCFIFYELKSREGKHHSTPFLIVIGTNKKLYIQNVFEQVQIKKCIIVERLKAALFLQAHQKSFSAFKRMFLTVFRTVGVFL